jgi:molecular chaperone GrpE
MEDYQKLAAAFNQLQGKFQELQGHAQTLQSQHDQTLARLEEQTKQASKLEQELAIKSDALHKQSEALKELESELVFAQAARQRLEEQQNAEEEAGWQEKFARLQADMENMRKRFETRKEQEIIGERNRILADMLPLADHLDLALQHADVMDALATKDFVANIEATRHAFMETLKRYGVERLDAEGQPFDPNLHEAMGQVEHPEIPADHVAQVIQTGYRDRERIVRPARVLISNGTGQSEA